MNRPSTSCSDDHLWSLLQADDGDDNQISANHIAQCHRCQSRLEQLAAEPAEWRDIRDSLLVDDEIDAATNSAYDNDSNDSRRWARERWARPIAWSASLAKSLLSEASHPEMLGRIGRYDASLTRSGFHPGTPHYMSPEQVRGEAIDARSDLFGLGCVLYAMCTGHPPFRAETSYAVLRRITDDPARPIRERNSKIAEWLERIVMNLLSKSPTDRFESAEEVAELLEDCLAHVQHPITSPLPDSVEQLSQSLPSPQSGGFDRKQLSKWLFTGFAAFSLIFAGVLIVLEYNKGTLTIQCDSDDVPIRILRGDKAVQQLTVSQAGKSIRIAAGNYVVEVDHSFDGAVVHEGRVSLKRGDTETVRITLTAAESSASAIERVAAHSSVASGKVLTRSGKQVEVSIGAEDGVRLGDRLNVVNALQSEVEVIRVQNNQSLARIVGEDNSSPIRPGAQVVLSRPRPSTSEGNENASSAVVLGTGKVVAFVPQERQQALKESDELLAIDPDTTERAVELWLSGDDVPLVREGDQVRLEFEGWPAVGSTNSFRGEVTTIDPTADGEGQFRILVKADSNDSWPEKRYLRPGVRANGWVVTRSQRDREKKVSDTLDASPTP